MDHDAAAAAGAESLCGGWRCKVDVGSGSELQQGFRPKDDLLPWQQNVGPYDKRTAAGCTNPGTSTATRNAADDCTQSSASSGAGSSV